MKRHYNAIFAQSACNIIPLARALNEAIDEVIHEHGGTLNTPTDVICNDAAVRLIVEQLAWPTKGRDYISAFAECEDLQDDRTDPRVHIKLDQVPYVNVYKGGDGYTGRVHPTKGEADLVASPERFHLVPIVPSPVLSFYLPKEKSNA